MTAFGPPRPPALNPGDVFTVRYPFIRSVYHGQDDADGSDYQSECWRPGIEYADADGYHDPRPYAHGRGVQTLTVVSTHKPGRYQTRVFYTRQWTDPDGKMFGKTKLMMTTAEKFRRISQKFSVDYDVEDDAHEPH